MARRPSPRKRLVAELVHATAEQKSDPKFVAAHKRFDQDAMRAGWHWLYANTLARLRQADRTNSLEPGDRQRLAIAMGIATEKAILLDGRPTQTVLNIHEVRASLPELLTKLASVRALIEVKTEPVQAAPSQIEKRALTKPDRP